MEQLEEILTSIYCDVDEFCAGFEEYWRKHLLTDGTPIIPKCAMSLAEIMTIVVFFHLSNQRTFKWYYNWLICGPLKGCFLRRLSYNRFIEIMQNTIVPLTVYLMKFRVGKCSGVSFMDSATIDVCHNRRIHSHQVFRDIAQRGKTSVGWFYGFKLHLVINDEGEILACCLTAGNVDGRDWETISSLTHEIFGKLFADKGYISQKLFEKLLQQDITLITGIRKNMKNQLMEMEDIALSGSMRNNSIQKTSL